MKWITLIAFFCVLGTGARAQAIESYSFSSLDEKIQQESQKQVVLVNFWATWCKPCIKELPYFEALGKDMQDVKVMLVSLDMEKERAEQYAQKKQLQAEVLYLDEVDFNSWIDQISPDWSGAIPATLMISPNGQQAFFEGSFTQDQLYETVNRFIKNSQ